MAGLIKELKFKESLPFKVPFYVCDVKQSGGTEFFNKQKRCENEKNTDGVKYAKKKRSS